MSLEVSSIFNRESSFTYAHTHIHTYIHEGAEHCFSFTDEESKALRRKIK